MAHAEDLLVEGARRATVAVRERWWHGRAAAERREIPLTRVKRRLDLFVTALCGLALPIEAADPRPAPTWLARALGRAPRHLDVPGALPSTDGARVWLPRTLRADEDEHDALRTYRLLALEQVARVVRGTPLAMPEERFARDLYLLAEARAVDRAIARQFPGLAADLVEHRSLAMRDRPALRGLRPLERFVERLVRDALSVDPGAASTEVPESASPAESGRWAERVSAEHRDRSTYRGVRPVALWGESANAPAHAHDLRSSAGERDDAPRSGRSASLRHRPTPRRASPDEDDPSPGTWMVRGDEPMESAEDPMGLQRPADRDDDANAADLADALSELPEARVVRTPGRAREVLAGDPGTRRPVPPAPGPIDGAAGIVYPEWDYRASAYRQRGAVVRPRRLRTGSADWVEDVMRRHAILVRRVRRRFDGLRARRVRVRRQPDGPELDLSAYVEAFADRRARYATEDRFYTAIRPRRRDLALVLLIDASASTDSWVSGSSRIIDVEKEAVVVLLEALDALGDRHAVLAFSGNGPLDVQIATLKDFDERGGIEVRRRVAALEPDGYTRAGAAIRHASAVLAREAARHRLLLILSDGKPNDVDAYEGRYGIEDTRQAVAEAHLQGLVPFCLTVDRDAPGYLPAVFGRTGYAMLPRQEALPSVLVEVVRRLLST